MFGYKITFDGLPKTVWACETTVTNYSWHNRSNAHTIEIGLSKASCRTVILNNKSQILGDQYVLSCIVGAENRISFSDPDVSVNIASIAVEFPTLQVEEKELTPEDCLNQAILLLPASMQDLSADALARIRSGILTYIRHYANSTAYNQMLCFSALFTLLADIDSLVRRSFDQHGEKNSYYYVRKIQSIIRSRYHEKLTQDIVARELHISAGYLSAMYRQATGATFSEHLLKERMNRAQEMLQNPNIPTRAVAQATGFADESYFRKRFKQYFKMNVREYRYIKQGLTLYHDKPVRPNDHT